MIGHMICYCWILCKKGMDKDSERRRDCYNRSSLKSDSINKQFLLDGVNIE